MRTLPRLTMGAMIQGQYNGPAIPVATPVDQPAPVYGLATVDPPVPAVDYLQANPTVVDTATTASTAASGPLNGFSLNLNVPAVNLVAQVDPGSVGSALVNAYLGPQSTDQNKLILYGGAALLLLLLLRR